MLPAPAQGAIVVVCRQNHQMVLNACSSLNHTDTEICTHIEKDFLRTLLGGCSTPISALAQIHNNKVHFQGNIFSVDGRQRVDVEKIVPLNQYKGLGRLAANELLSKGGKPIADAISHNR